MKIIMVAAISRDGFITKGKDPDVSKWTSVEDKEFFQRIKSKHNLFVMGRKTYDSGLVLPKPGTLKLILSTNSKKYSSLQIPGQLEFSDLSPQEFVKIYMTNYESCLLLGGGITYSTFLEANLVDEIYLTIEPLLFNTGTPLLNYKSIDDYTMGFKPKITILNDYGTVLHHYVLKNI